MSAFSKFCPSVEPQIANRAAPPAARLCRKLVQALALCLCCLLSGLPLLVGCGSGGGHSAGSNATRSGKVTITIVWPQTKAGSKTRVIPDETQSIVVSLYAVSGSASTLARTVVIARGTTTSTLDNLPLGRLSVSARAYTLPDGTGTLLATADLTITIQANQSTNIPIVLDSVVTNVSINNIAQLPTTLIPGQFLQLTAQATDNNGSTVLVAPSSSLQWSSSDPNVASVDTLSGVVTANKQGAVTITVGVKEAPSVKLASVTLTVSQGFVSSITIDQPSPLLLTVEANPVLTATVKDNNNNTIKVNGLKWASDNPAVASVDPNSGVVTANALGAANISVTLGQISAAITVRVGSGALDHIVITPNPANSMPLTQGQQLTLTAVGYDKAGNPVGIAANNLTWKSSDTNVANGTPDSSGNFLVTGHYAGTTNVTVTDIGSSPAISASLPVSVRVNVSITPVTDPIPLGGTAQFTATVTGTDNQAVTWSVLNNRGQITATGLYTAPTSPRVTATYTVIATSQADTSQQAQTPIKVAVGSGQIQIQ